MCTLYGEHRYSNTKWSVLVLSQRAEGGRSQLLEQMWLDGFAVWRWITLGIDNSNTCAVYASATINVKVQQQLQGGPGDKRQRPGYTLHVFSFWPSFRMRKVPLTGTGASTS